MKNRYLANGAEVVFAFETPETSTIKHAVFLAGTTGWHADLLTDSWRRWLLHHLDLIDQQLSGVVFYVPEPRHGTFINGSYGLTEWETAYLDQSTIHAYWLNTYWDYKSAIANCDAQAARYYSDGERANIGITVRSELGVSFARYKYQNDLSLVLGAPHDAEALEWLETMCRVYEAPLYRLLDKRQIIDLQWIERLLQLLN